MNRLLAFALTAYILVLGNLSNAHAQTIHWKDHDWRVTQGHMAGVALGDPANVSIDKNGYLHLQIVKHQDKWTAAEVFTTDDMGFGTYQWVVEGSVYAMDKSTVLGLFTYGPVHHFGGDAENEIDIEFSQWNLTCHGCNADFTVYPSTGNRKPKGISAWEDNFHADNGSTLTTARFQWSPDHIVFTIMNGAQPIGTTADVIKTETYSSDPTNIPQVASPVGINLWSFRETASADQSVVIREFQFRPR